MWNSPRATRELKNVVATAVARNPAGQTATITVKCTVAGQSQSLSRSIGGNATYSFTFNFSSISSVPVGASVNFYFTSCQPASNGGFTADYYLQYPTITAGDSVSQTSAPMMFLLDCGATLSSDSSRLIKASGTRFEGPGISTGPGQGSTISIALINGIYNAMQNNFGSSY